jgi:preprotein translocase subunit SecE
MIVIVGTMPAKKFWPSLSVKSKKKCNPYFIVVMITVLITNVIFWVVKLKIILSFLLHRTFTSGYLCTIALILFIHFGFLEYLSFKQFKLIVEMTRIESGVTIPKGLFTLYLNVKKVTAKIFWPP